MTVLHRGNRPLTDILSGKKLTEPMVKISTASVMGKLGSLDQRTERENVMSRFHTRFVLT